MSQGAAVPGTNVPASAQVSPGGPQGVLGAQGTAGPSTPSADIGNLLITGSDSLLCLPPSQIQPVIWSARLRSFNAIGNSNAECNQRNPGTTLALAAGASGFAIDRWAYQTPSTTAVASAQQSNNKIPVPGTNFLITQNTLLVTLTAQKTSLAAGDSLQFIQYIEGPQLRELINDVHSLQILCRSSVVGLKFGLAIQDSANAYSYVMLCTIPTANTPTLIQFPNIPIFPAGTFPLTPGSNGYQIRLCLAAGSTYTASTNGTWLSGNFVGANGQSNFCASPVNSTFELCFLQHEPGSQCSILVDKPFALNESESMRYFGKSYDYKTLPGTVTTNGSVSTYSIPNGHAFVFVPYKAAMAKVPTLTGYNPTTGAINSIHDYASGTERAISGAQTPGENYFGGFILSTVNASQPNYAFQFIADTGW